MTGAEIGLIGLGTMGAAVALNTAETGFANAVWSRSDQLVRNARDALAFVPMIFRAARIQAAGRA